ncbi:MAG: VCBS repeat-containing protein [Acidobacteriota bacterium]
MPVETTVARSDLEPVDPSSSGTARSTVDTAPGPATSRRSRRRWLRRLVLGGGVVVVSTLATMLWIDRVGWRFFDTGAAIVDTMATAAEAIADEDWTALEALYDPRYRGAALGLDAHTLLDERDGVRVYDLGGGPRETLDRTAAVAEWRAYRAGFETIEAVDLFLHRLESWSDRDEWIAVARFELIGTPLGEARSGIDRGLVRLRFGTTADGPRLIGAEPLDGDRVIASEPHFVDVAADAGIDFENRYYPAFLPENRDEPLAFGMLKYGPAGITAVDVDDDGFHDLFVPDGVEARLFRNLGDGTFEDRTATSGLAGLDGVGVGVFADIDNDGDQDAFISRTFEPNQLWRNNGDWTFTDVTAEAGIGADCCTTVASWGDIDNDGFLDLYVGRYLEPRREIPTTFYARNGEPNQLYRNNGDGTFTNITEAAGVGEVGLCLGTVFGDYDDDGDADLYVVNDFGRKTLYRNEGDSTFTDVTVETGTLAYGAGMSASFGDADNDGDLDLYVAHIRSEEAWFAEWPTVFRYMTNSWRQGVWVSDMPLYLEIFRQSGFAFVQVFQDMASGNTLLQNDGDGTFTDITWTAGLSSASARKSSCRRTCGS